MPSSVNHNQAPQNDPYADPYADEAYGSDPYSDYYGDEEGMSVEGGDGYYGGEEGYEESAPLTVESMRQSVSDLEEMLKFFEGSAEEKKDIQDDINKLKAKINATVGMSPTAQEKILAQLNEKLFEIEGTIMGTGEEGGGSLKSQIEDLRKKLDEYKAAGQISQSAYDKGIKELEKADVIYGVEGDSDLGASQIEEILSEVTDILVNGVGSSEGAQKLSEVTGMDLEELEALLAKHGLDANNLPNPPDAKVAALVQEIVTAELEARNAAYTEGQSAIDSATSQCNAINQANTASDTSVADSVDFTPFKTLNDIKNKQGDTFNSKFAQPNVNVAKKTAEVLSALYGVEVTAIEGDPSKAGMINFNGTELNVLSNAGSSAQISFTNTPPEFPNPDLVPIYVDNEGDGSTDCPQWMRDAHYPYNVYDTGGAAYGTYSDKWNW